MQHQRHSRRCRAVDVPALHAEASLRRPTEQDASAKDEHTRSEEAEETRYGNVLCASHQLLAENVRYRLTPVESGKSLWAKKFRCGNVYTEERVKAIFIEGLHGRIVARPDALVDRYHGGLSHLGGTRRIIGNLGCQYNEAAPTNECYSTAHYKSWQIKPSQIYVATFADLMSTSDAAFSAGVD